MWDYILSTNSTSDILCVHRSLVCDLTQKEDKVLVLSYSRKVLGQTGDGHFSPVGGYHPEKDLVLILDTARFKYPPHWVPLRLIWEAMLALDKSTGQLNLKLHQWWLSIKVYIIHITLNGVRRNHQCKYFSLRAALDNISCTERKQIILKLLKTERSFTTVLIHVNWAIKKDSSLNAFETEVAYMYHLIDYIL